MSALHLVSCEGKIRPFAFFLSPWGCLIANAQTITSPEAFIRHGTNVLACVCLQAFLTLARDIKAKMDKKLVRAKEPCFTVSWQSKSVVFAVFLKRADCRLCISGGQQPSEQQSGSQDFRTAQEEQLFPLHAPVRRPKRRHPPSP